MVQEEEKEAQEEEEIVEEEEVVEEGEEEESEEPAEERPRMELPPVSFENLIFGLYSTARFHLGTQNPETGDLMQNLPVAKHTIDTLIMIQEKTKGNLTAPESNLMENLLYELRMTYLRAAQQASGKTSAAEEEPEVAEKEKSDDEE